MRERWSAERDRDPLGQVVAHGDVRMGNLMNVDERPVFVDLELSGVGPASWDLVVQAVHVRRYGRAESEYRSFVAGYGLPADNWCATGARAFAGFAALCEIYELLCVVWTLGCSSVHPVLELEARLRLRSFLGDESGNWTLT